MFNHLTDFAYQRTGKEAVGFYIIYLLLSLLIGGFLGVLTSVIFQDEVVFKAMLQKIVIPVASLYCIVLSFTVLKHKKLLGRLAFIFLAILSGIVAVFIGTLGGLVVVAFLTTRKPLEEADQVKS